MSIMTVDKSFFEMDLPPAKSGFVVTIEAGLWLWVYCGVEQPRQAGLRTEARRRGGAAETLEGSCEKRYLKVASS